MQHVSRAADSTVSVGRTVDWGFAATVGEKLARPGPAATDYTRRQAIDQLAEASRRAELPVRDVTELREGGEIPEARIVDRPQWIRAATQSMRVMTGGTEGMEGMEGTEGIEGTQKNGTRRPSISGRITGAQTGAVLAFISTGILGQYDPFGPNGGELLLVYPNVIAVERQLRVQPADFRLWVCLHEVTHRVQFRANPWLAEHMSAALAVLTKETASDVSEIVGRLSGFVRDRTIVGDDPNSQGMIGFLRAIQSEPQRDALDQLLVLGTLLEGHADHVMDAVGPAVVPTVATIRRRFDERRRRKQSPLQRVMRAALGFDAKLAQYTRGKAFVDHVVSRVGMARFNTIWTGPETLPLPAEVDEPQRWINRVL
jgi:coenzyme F420 biosynthesis associated uncharacterized protein